MTLYTLLFDVTANDGWNLTAYMVWFAIAGLVWLAWKERKA